MFNYRLPRLVIGLCSALIVCVSAGYSAQLENVTVVYSSFSGDYVPLWLGVEDRIGKKYGIDLKAVYAGRARPQQLLISGEALIAIASGTGALTSHILGVKDQVIILTFSNKVPGVIVAKPEIKSGLDRLSFQYPQAKQTDPNLIFDASLIKRIEQSGFVDSLKNK